MTQSTAVAGRRGAHTRGRAPLLVVGQGSWCAWPAHPGSPQELPAPSLVQSRGGRLSYKPPPHLSYRIFHSTEYMSHVLWDAVLGQARDQHGGHMVGRPPRLSPVPLRGSGTGSQTVSDPEPRALAPTRPPCVRERTREAASAHGARLVTALSPVPTPRLVALRCPEVPSAQTPYGMGHVASEPNSQGRPQSGAVSTPVAAGGRGVMSREHTEDGAEPPQKEQS